jgi:flagellar biosynthesis protein FliP
MRFAAHYSFQELEPAQRLPRTAQALGNLFKIVAPFIVILIVTAVLMAVGWGFRAAAVDADGNVIDAAAFTVYQFVHLKEAIWLVMALNYGYMVWRLVKAKKSIALGDMPAAKVMLGMIGKYLVPLNILLGVTAIYLGVVLRYSHA